MLLQLIELKIFEAATGFVFDVLRYFFVSGYLSMDSILSKTAAPLHDLLIVCLLPKFKQGPLSRQVLLRATARP